MRIAIFGAGAVGLYFARRFLAAGEEVAMVARGAALEALRAGRGRYHGEGRTYPLVLRATDRPAELGPQEVVLIAVKGHALAEAAPAIARLVGPETVLVPAQNGIPWWYGHRLGGALDGVRIEAIDPNGDITRYLDPARALGCVVYIAGSTPAPGEVRHLSGNRMILGEPDGSMGRRLDAVASLFRRAGIATEVTDRIRDALWLKLWGNMTANPISILTRGTLVDLCDDPGTLWLQRDTMAEAERIAEAMGIRFPCDIAARIAETRGVGPHKSSSLQDFEAGRVPEIAPLLGAPLELGHQLGIRAPKLNAILALAQLAARVRLGQ
ncbi:MAG: ketopantoate reductase family protein [Stellaceae bacterium]